MRESLIKEGRLHKEWGRMLFTYCLVCNQLIRDGDVSVLREGRRVHPRCVDPRYYQPPGFPDQVKVVNNEKK